MRVWHAHRGVPTTRTPNVSTTSIALVILLSVMEHSRMRLSRLAALVMVAILQIGTLIPQEASAAPPAITAWEAQRFRTEAKRLADKDRYREAIPLAEKALAFEEQQNPTKNPLKLAEALFLLADITFKNGELKRAEGLYDRALAIREKELGTDHPLVADVLHGLAGTHLERWSFRKAEELTRRALAIREKRFGADSLEVAAMSVPLALSLRVQGKFTESRGMLTTALAIRERLLGKDHPDVAVILDALGELDVVQGWRLQGQKNLERALAIRDKAFGPGSLGSTTSMLGLAECRGDTAILWAQRALAIREEVLGHDHHKVVEAYLTLGRLHFEKGHLPGAKQAVHESLRILGRKINEPYPGPRLRSAHLLVWIHLKALELSEASDAYASAEALLNQADEAEMFPVIMAEHLQAKGFYLRVDGNYAQAENALRHAYTMMATLYGDEHLGVEGIRLLLAMTLVNRGNYTEAEPLMLESTRQFERKYGPASDKLMGARFILGSYLVAHNEATSAERAVRLFQAVLAAGEQNDDPAIGRICARAYEGLASAYLIQGKVSDAENSIMHSLRLHQKVSPVGMEEATPVWTFSYVRLMQRNIASAEKLGRLAFRMEEPRWSDDHPRIGVALAKLSEIVLAAGHLDEAISLMQRAADLWERQTQRMLAGGSEEQRRAFFAMLQPDTDAAISLAAHHAPAANLALTVILRRKGRVIDAMHDTFSELRRNLDPQAQDQFQRLRDVQREISMHYTASSGGALSDKSRERVQALEKEREDIERDLSLRSNDFARETKPLDIATVQAAIPEHAALVEIVAYRPFHPGVVDPDKRWGKRRYAAYVLQRKGNVALADLGEGAAIDAAVERFRTALADPRRDAKKPARNLDALVLAPVRRLLGDAHHVLISPDGALNLVPFGALVDERGRYLLESYDFTYLTSGRDLLRAPAQPAATHEAVIFANPDFGPGNAPIATDNQRGVRSAALGILPPFERLAETEVEAQQIAKSLSGAQVLLGENATEEALKALRAPRILHLATHAFFLPKEVVENESTAEGEVAGRLELRRENRLLRSGLALAGANARKNRIDDGIVTALEASGLNLDGTKLVSLSACETAVGNASDGDGVYGLRRALLFAGAEAQVLSLWRVDDQATRRLMVGYYQKLASGSGRSAAMRDVALEMLHNSPLNHPYFWAAFIVSGNWRSLEGKDVGPIVPTVAPGPRGCQCETGANVNGDASFLCLLMASGVLWGRRAKRGRG